MAQTNLEVIISARDNFTGTANRVIGSLNRMQSSAGRVTRGVGQLGGGLVRLGAVAAGAAAVGIAAAARQAFTYEDSIAGVAKTTDLTTAEIKQLGLELRTMATQIPIGVNELARLAETAGALGVEGRDNIRAFAEVTAKLGVTTNLTSDMAAEALGHISAVLKLTREDYDRFGATLVDLGNKGASTEAQIAGIAERASGGAATIGLTTQALLGWSAAIANIGVEVEAGGTNFQKFLIEAAKNVAAGGDELDIMAKTAGRTAAQFRKDFGADPSSALSQFVTGLGKLNTEQRLAVLGALSWDDQRLARILLGLSANTDNLTDSLTNANTAWDEGTALNVEAQKRFDTTASKLKLLRAAILEAALTFAGDPSDPKTLAGSIGVVAEKLRVALLDPSNKAALEGFGRDIGRAISSIDFDELIATAKTLASVFKNDVVPVLMAAFHAFNALPGPIKGVITSLAVLSQTPVLGGAFKDILGGLGNIGGGILGGVGGALGRTAVGSVFAQPVRVVNWPIGFGAPGTGGTDIIAGGGLRGLISNIVKVAIPLLAVAGLTIGIAELGLFLTKDIDTKGPPRGTGHTRPDKPTEGGVGPDDRGPLFGGLSPDERGEKRFAQLVADAFGTHIDAIVPFATRNAQNQSVNLKRFRTDPQAAIDLFDDRIRYLAGAKGAGGPNVPGNQKYLDVIGRDIAALQRLLPRATPEQQEQIKAEIVILQGILKEKKFTPDQTLIDAATRPLQERLAAEMEKHRGREIEQDGAKTRSEARTNAERFRSAVATDTQRTVAAIRAIQAPSVTTNVSVSVTANGIRKTSSTQVHYGPSAGSVFHALELVR